MVSHQLQSLKSYHTLERRAKEAHSSRHCRNLTAVINVVVRPVPHLPIQSPAAQRGTSDHCPHLLQTEMDTGGAAAGAAAAVEVAALAVVLISTTMMHATFDEGATLGFLTGDTRALATVVAVEGKGDGVAAVLAAQPVNDGCRFMHRCEIARKRSARANSSEMKRNQLCVLDHHIHCNSHVFPDISILERTGSVVVLAQMVSLLHANAPSRMQADRPLKLWFPLNLARRRNLCHAFDTLTLALGSSISSVTLE